MAVWATALFQRDEHPTDTNGGAFTAATAAGLLPTLPPLAAIYPLSSTAAVVGFATGASIAIMRKP